MMTPDNDYLVNPVENLQNIGALAPIDRRSERKNRQRQQKRNSENDRQNSNEETTIAGNEPEEQDTIDFCA